MCIVPFSSHDVPWSFGWHRLFLLLLPTKKGVNFWQIAPSGSQLRQGFNYRSFRVLILMCHEQVVEAVLAVCVVIIMRIHGWWEICSTGGHLKLCRC